MPSSEENSNAEFKLFISYTAQDLQHHANEVRKICQEVGGWTIIDHSNWPSSGRPSVEECLTRLCDCDALLLLSAFRYGWVPSPKQAGDGIRSITNLEWDLAGDLMLPRAALLAAPKGHWPVEFIEGLNNPEAAAASAEFRTQLESTLRGQYFSWEPESIGPLVRKTLTELRDQLMNPASKVQRTPGQKKLIPTVSIALERNIFPASLKVRQFLPQEKLVISYRIGAAKAGRFWTFAALLTIPVTVVCMGNVIRNYSDYFDWASAFGPLVFLVPVILIASRGYRMVFDLRERAVRIWTLSSATKQSVTSGDLVLKTALKGKAWIAVLEFEDFEIARSNPHRTATLAQRELYPFAFALNRAMGIFTLTVKEAEPQKE